MGREETSISEQRSKEKTWFKNISQKFFKTQKNGWEKIYYVNVKIVFSTHKGIYLIAQVQYDKFTVSEKEKCNRWES